MSDPTPPAQPPRRPPLSLGRRIVAAIAILVMLYSGGCIAWQVTADIRAYDPSDHLAFLDTDIAAVFGGIPFLVALLILLATLWPRLSPGMRGAGLGLFGAVLVLIIHSFWYGSRFVDASTLLILGSIPFAVGLLFWWLASRVR